MPVSVSTTGQATPAPLLHLPPATFLLLPPPPPLPPPPTPPPPSSIPHPPSSILHPPYSILHLHPDLRDRRRVGQAQLRSPRAAAGHGQKLHVQEGDFLELPLSSSQACPPGHQANHLRDVLRQAERLPLAHHGHPQVEPPPSSSLHPSSSFPFYSRRVPQLTLHGAYSPRKVGRQQAGKAGMIGSRQAGQGAGSREQGAGSRERQEK